MLWPQSGKSELLDDLIRTLLEFPPGPLYTMVAVLAAIENIIPPVPADTAVALGAFLSVGGEISANTVFAVTWGANVTSAIAVYVAARHLGRPFFTGRIGRRLLKPRNLARLERVYDRYGTWGIFLSRFIPGARAVVAPFAGIAGLGAGRTIVPIAVASAIWYGSLTFVAATFVREIDQISRLIRGVNQTGLITGAVAMVALVGWLFWRRKPWRPWPWVRGARR
jgi:membrane protein DedA with SNARE-associated domain